MNRNIIIALLVLVCLWLFFFYKAPRITGDGSVTPEAKKLADTEVKRVNKKIDEKGFEHAVIEEVENVVGSVHDLDTSARRELDSVKKLLSVKDRQITQWISYSATLRDSFLVAKRQGDTSFRYSDKWADIEYVRPKDTLSSGHFNFSYNADINYAEYWRKAHFLAPKRHYIDFWISDPRATINGVKRVKFESKPPMTRVEVNALGLYDRGLNVGVDGAVRFGPVRVGAGYVYNLDDGDWRTIITTRYRLLEF